MRASGVSYREDGCPKGTDRGGVGGAGAVPDLVPKGLNIFKEVRIDLGERERNSTKKSM